MATGVDLAPHLQSNVAGGKLHNTLIESNITSNGFAIKTETESLSQLMPPTGTGDSPSSGLPNDLSHVPKSNGVSTKGTDRENEYKPNSTEKQPKPCFLTPSASSSSSASTSSSASIGMTSSFSNDLSRESSNNTLNISTVSTSFTSPFPTTSSSSPNVQLISTLHSSFARLEKGKDISTLSDRVKPRSSISSRFPASVYAQQCVDAAYASRLNPYALHKNEHEILQDHLCHLHVTTYLNIRNSILRLWTRNPMVSVTEDEALGCAKDYRWMPLAAVSYDWLVRNGYINFGCISIPKSLTKRNRRKDGPTIVIVGAGMAGLGCARQLHGLFQHYYGNSLSPKIIILEGRKRIGGRIYSHPLKSLTANRLAPGLLPTAEMGAHIIVGFDNGNPLDPIIRAQLAVGYHLLRDISTIYDTDGSPVDEIKDAMTEKLYNDILDRSGAYRYQSIVTPTAEGDKGLVDAGRDSSLDDGVTIRQLETAVATGTIGSLLPSKRLRRGVGHKTADIKPPIGPPLSELLPTKEHSAAVACQAMGWRLKGNVTSDDSISLSDIAKASSNQTLGAVMDRAVEQYQRLLEITPKDMRLLNWHFANLEYANAANVGKLSLSGWDQDVGNEFEGEHAQVIGGYQQLPRGLWALPSKLDVRTNKLVSKISYHPTGAKDQKSLVYCEDGEIITADKVVVTAPLGVLKQPSGMNFSPILPEWKTGAIERLGFGLLNKVILVFESPFWNVDRDMFGLLREPEVLDSMSQNSYRFSRGQFYLFWNCMPTSGVPMLIALMAGDSAHRAEVLSDHDIVDGVMSQLRNIFKDEVVPNPLETIVTRWGQDKFTRGSYSYVAADALPGDYDLMARPIGNLYFAGEATCGTHPATVHGAYLSGLRAAKEVLESILGPINVPSPLVLPKNKTNNSSSFPTTPTHSSGPSPQKKRKAASALDLSQTASSVHNGGKSSPTSPISEDALRKLYDEAMWQAIISELGPADPRPHKLPLNPFLLYQKDYWHICKAECDNSKRRATGKESAKAPRDEIRQALGQMWRDADPETKKPYLDRIDLHRQQNEEALVKWKEKITEWERRTYEVKDQWCAQNPMNSFIKSMKSGDEPAGIQNKARKLSC
ncbi:hypothetical protein FQN57_002222 [Myotisia sp. PD_48]|nr:hypothetical protein FQN57_002222 [Myotisia sp. PD_48]